MKCMLSTLFRLYDKEVTGLRKLNLLTQIRTNAQASVLAKKNQSRNKKYRDSKLLPPELS